jgi:hypothetical protein
VALNDNLSSSDVQIHDLLGHTAPVAARGRTQAVRAFPGELLSTGTVSRNARLISGPIDFPTLGMLEVLSGRGPYWPSALNNLGAATFGEI